MFLSEWREFLSAPCLEKKNLMTARVSMLLKSRASLTCFRACFLPRRAKDLSAPRVCTNKEKILIYASNNKPNVQKRNNFMEHSKASFIGRSIPRFIVNYYC